MQPLGLGLGVADTQMAQRRELQVLAQQLVDATPDLARAVGQRQLRQHAALPAHVAEVGAAGLAADEFALEQRHAQPALAQEERGRRADQAAAQYQDIGIVHGGVLHRHSATSCVLINSGLTGACARRRPTCSIGTRASAATISAAACAQ